MEELINRLRNCASYTVEDCTGCPYIRGYNGTYCMNGLVTEAADAIEVFSKKEKTTQWIPVTERLPDMHVEALVCTEEYGETALGFAMVAVFDGTGWLETWERKTYLTAVTHWMPLPEPPKEE